MKGAEVISVLDLEAFDRAPLQHDPCDFVVVPGFVRAEVLEAFNRDYPQIEGPGNFAPQALSYGPTVAAMLEELNSPLLRQKFGEKFGIDLSPYPLQMTLRKYAQASDGNVHNDSKGKIVTALIYFNEDWPHEGGKLRLLRSSWNIEDYAVEVQPVGGTLIPFKRSETSFHGYKRCEAERRSLQMYWVKPKRAARGGQKRIGLKKMVKRLLKLRPRWSAGGGASSTKRG